MNVRISLCAILSLLLAGCAGQRLPEGGPVDTNPPEIVSVFPQPGSTGFGGSSILFEFSEYVDRRTTEEAVFISPNIEEKEFDWSGKEMEIIFHEELRKNTTYVVTIGTDVTDIRAGNRMAKAFTLSFSTGPTIDKGMIEGKVFDEKPDGVMIFSYRLNDIRPDTLNPAVTKPDYLSQAGKNGEFFLKNIAPGSYRLFAVRDDYRNLLYEPEVDAAGTTGDITLTLNDTLRTGVQFILAKEDTTPPRLAQVQAADERHVHVQFSEEMDSASIMTNAFTITDTVFTTSLPVSGLYPRDESQKNFTLLTAPQRADELYVLSVRGVKDRAQHPIHPSANAKQFNSSAAKDTIPPFLASSSVRDASAKIFPDERISLTFSEALRQPLADTAIIVRRSKDSTVVPLTLSFRTLASVVLQPKKPWGTGEQYSLQVKWNSIADQFGNAGKDTTTAVMFTADDPENYGSIEGNFAGYPAASTVILTENILDKKQLPKKAVANASGAFLFERLPEGRYVLKAFDDVNGNRRHDAGTVYPYTMAERFTNYSDTIRVRPRWPVDGVIFKAP
jgi:hypothetical protein